MQPEDVICRAMHCIPVVVRATLGILGPKEVSVVRVVQSRSHRGPLQRWTHDVERGAN